VEKLAVFTRVVCLVLVAPVALLALPTTARSYHAAPTGLKVAGTTPESASLDWDDYTAFPIRGYRVFRYSRLGTLIDRRNIGKTSGHAWTALEPSTTYLFAVQAVGLRGHLSQQSARVTATTAAASSSCPDGEYQAQYWPNVDLTGTPAVIRCEFAVDHDWLMGGPPGLPVDNFAARYEGIINLQAGSYDFSVTADDGVRLWIDGTLVIDKWTDQSATTYTVTRTMTAGLHDVRVEHYERRGAAVIRLTTAQARPPPPIGCATPPCFDWLGNTFPGQNYNHVTTAGQDLAVSGDGVAVTGAQWNESAHDVRAFTTDGRPQGPRPGSSAGRFRENGRGPRAVDATNTHLYATNARRIVRWDRQTWFGFNPEATYNGHTLTIPGTGELLGLTICGGEVYVVDPGISADSTSPNGAMVKVLNADLTGGVKRQWTVPRARHLACDREENIWVLQQRTSTASGRLAHYAPAGASLGGFDVSGEPMDVAANPAAGEVLVADNGPDQRVERYTYAGVDEGTLGESYLNGPTPGLLGPTRFVGPRGVDVDSQGNVYVMQSCIPGRGTNGWLDEELGECMIVSKHQPNGTQVWRSESTAPMSVGEPSADNERFYTQTMSYRRVNGRFESYAFTADPFRDADPRLSGGPLNLSRVTTTLVRDLGARRYLAQVERRGANLNVYRLDGEIGRHVRTFSAGLAGDDWFMAENGDVWRPGRNGQVQRYALTSLSPEAWTPPQTFPAPPGFSSLRRIEVHGSTVYVSGYGPGAEFEAGFDDWMWSGKRIARFNDLPTASGWPAAAWARLLPWGPNPGHAPQDRPNGWSTDDNRIALAYQADSGNKGYLKLLSAATGADAGEIHWPARFGLTGWYDIMRPVTYVNGQVWAEENHLGKLLMVQP
jgi:hypothetical protein